MTSSEYGKNKRDEIFRILFGEDDPGNSVEDHPQDGHTLQMGGPAPAEFRWPVKVPLKFGQLVAYDDDGGLVPAEPGMDPVGVVNEDIENSSLFCSVVKEMWPGVLGAIQIRGKTEAHHHMYELTCGNKRLLQAIDRGSFDEYNIIAAAKDSVMRMERAILDDSRGEKPKQNGPHNMEGWYLLEEQSDVWQEHDDWSGRTRQILTVQTVYQRYQRC